MDNIKLPNVSTIETESMNFIDKNFNYINLLLFAGLYIVCFIYLLQDTVKSISSAFSDIIGMFVGEVAFFIIISLLMSYEEMNFYNFVIWTLIFLSSLLLMISGGFLLLKYKNIQDEDSDNKKIKIEDKMADFLGDNFKENFLEIYKFLLIVFDLAVIVLIMIYKFIPNVIYISFIIWFLIFTILIISGIMLYISILVSNANTKKINNTNEAKINKMTIPALTILCVFHIFFTFFISFIISKKANGTLNWLLKISWGSIFITSIFQIISLFIVIITYNYLNDNFISKNITLPNFFNMILELKDYNNLFVSVTTIVIVNIFILLKGHDFLNAQQNIFFKPYYYSSFIMILSVAALSMSSEMIKISDDFLKYKKLTPIADPNTNANDNDTQRSK